MNIEEETHLVEEKSVEDLVPTTKSTEISVKEDAISELLKVSPDFSKTDSLSPVEFRGAMETLLFTLREMEEKIFWTKKNILLAAFRRKEFQGKSTEFFLAMAGCSKSYFSEVAKECGFTIKSKSEKIKQYLEANDTEGMSNQAIADAVGDVNKSTVGRVRAQVQKDFEAVLKDCEDSLAEIETEWNEADQTELSKGSESVDCNNSVPEDIDSNDDLEIHKVFGTLPINKQLDYLVNRDIMLVFSINSGEHYCQIYSKLEKNKDGVYIVSHKGFFDCSFEAENVHDIEDDPEEGTFEIYLN